MDPFSGVLHCMCGVIWSMCCSPSNCDHILTAREWLDWFIQKTYRWTAYNEATTTGKLISYSKHGLKYLGNFVSLRLENGFKLIVTLLSYFFLDLLSSGIDFHSLLNQTLLQCLLPVDLCHFFITWPIAVWRTIRQNYGSIKLACICDLCPKPHSSIGHSQFCFYKTKLFNLFLWLQSNSLTRVGLLSKHAQDCHLIE